MLHITDHRGRRHEIAPGALSEQSRRGGGRELVHLRLNCIVVAAAFYGAILQLIVTEVAPPTFTPPTALLWAGLGVVLTLAWLTDRALANRPWWYGPGAVPHHRRAMLARHRCPVCAYPLDTTSPAADACHPCPECGAAWRLPERPAP